MTTTLAHDQALDWFVRLSDPDAPETVWMDFQTWLEADPAHRQAYDLIEQVWVALDDATSADEVDAHPLVANDACPEPGRDRMETRARRSSPPWLPLMATAAAAVLVAGLWPELSGVGRFQTYSTTDAPRELVLSDGSRLSMNRHSDLRVRIGKRDREVILSDGEVAFDVTPDADRPFVVAAGLAKSTSWAPRSMCSAITKRSPSGCNAAWSLSPAPECPTRSGWRSANGWIRSARRFRSSHVSIRARRQRGDRAS